MSSNGVYCLKSLETYSNDYNLSWVKKDWQIKNQISDKLAIALLEPNAQARVKEIIMAIVNDVAK